MDKITIEQALIASQTGSAQNNNFTERVMKSIKNKRRLTLPFNIPSKFAKLAMALVAICCAVLTTGATYAAYQLWLNPSVEVQSTSQNQILATFTNCSTTASARYEIKSGSSLSLEEISQILQARCEISAIQSWRNSQGANDNEQVMESSEAYLVNSISGSKVSLQSSNLDKDVTVTNKTQFFVNGISSGADSIQVGDAVFYVELGTYNQGSGYPTKSDLLAIFKMDLPIEAYSVSKQNLVSERTACLGNPDDFCLADSASIDVYPRGSEGTSLGGSSGDLYEIQGKILSVSQEGFTLQGSSGALYQIATPLNIIDEFNQKSSSDYGVSIEVGDQLSVFYNQTSDDNHKIIQASLLSRVTLLMQTGNEKTDAMTKY